MADFINAAPQVYDEGIRDLSFRQVPPAPLELPQHLPVFYVFAEKGPVGRNYVDLGTQSIYEVYGTKTFEIGSKYHNHQTEFLRTAAANANNCVVHRLIPTDASDRSNAALYLDVLEIDVPLYEKNTDGSLKLDKDLEPIPVKDGSGKDTLIPGYSVCWVVDYTQAKLGEYNFATLTQRKGLQSVAGKQSTQYPIFEFVARDNGDFGNRLAVSLSACLRTDLTPFPAHLLDQSLMYPYRFSMSRLEDVITGVDNTVLNVFGTADVVVTTKKDGINMSTGGTMFIDDIVDNYYVDVPIEVNGGLGAVHTYTDNLKEISKMFYESESLVDDSFKDGQIYDGGEAYDVINIINFVNSNGSPYQSIKIVDNEDSIRLTRNTKIFLGGGNDGTMSNEIYESLIRADLVNYANPLHEYSGDQVMNPESIIYDSGFSLETKKAMCNIVSLRKDTFVVLGTFIDGQNLSIEEQFSLSISLRNFLELTPESEVYGTHVCRGLIMGGSGKLIASNYNKRVSVTHELLHKASRYMGSKSGSWVSGRVFDKAEGSVVETLKDIDITYIPAITRTKFWSASLNFTLNYKGRNQFIPALKTVYNDDTSVLNNFFTVMACCYLNKVSHAMWRRYSGSITLTSRQLEESVNKDFEDEVQGRFDNIVRVVPDCKVTEMDEIRGYSWTMNVKVYGNTMKTAMVARLETYRENSTI